MVVKTNKERLNDLVQLTLADGIIYDGSLDDINYFSLLCKSSNKNQLFKILGSNVCMFKHQYENKDSIMMVFSMPINLSPEISGKHISERVMDIISCVEDCFTTLDYVDLKEVKEDKSSYITIIKTLEGEEKHERKESEETKKSNNKRNKKDVKPRRKVKTTGRTKG